MAMDLDPRVDAALSRARFDDQRIGARRHGAEPDLADVATQFEALLLKQLVTVMRDSVHLDGKSDGDELTNHLIEDALATHLARSGGIGLADIIVRDAEGRLRPSSAGTEAGFAVVERAAGAATSPLGPLEAGARDAPGLGAVVPPVHDGEQAPTTATVRTSTPRALSDHLPPDHDAWLEDDDAAATLRRIIGPPVRKNEPGP